MHAVEAFATSERTACGRLADGLTRASRGDEELVTCAQCRRKLEAHQEPPGSEGGAALPGATPPSRSAAEARPPDMREGAEPAEEAWVCGSGAGGPWLPPELRPCCPDAGKRRCHGQPPGYCACLVCVRAERKEMRDAVRGLADLISWAGRRGVTGDEEEALRQGLAAVVAAGRGRWFAWRRWWRFERTWRRGAELEAEEMKARLERAGVEWHAVVRELTVERDAARREADDALIQASTAAERARDVEKALAAAEEREGQATDEVARLEGLLQRAGVVA